MLESFLSFLNCFNQVAWVLSNVLVAYIVLALIVFVVGYYALFNPKLTTAGKLIFRFAVSLICVLGLVFVGIFINPTSQTAWFDFPGDVQAWRPAIRLAGYMYVAYSITSLVRFLILRKWYPHKLKTATDRDLVKPRKI